MLEQDVREVGRGDKPLSFLQIGIVKVVSLSAERNLSASRERRAFKSSTNSDGATNIVVIRPLWTNSWGISLAPPITLAA